jgi:hypothetical protein
MPFFCHKTSKIWQNRRLQKSKAEALIDNFYCKYDYKCGFFGDSMTLRLSRGGPPPGNAEPQLGVENDVWKTSVKRRSRPFVGGRDGVGVCDGVLTSRRAGAQRSQGGEGGRAQLGVENDVRKTTFTPIRGWS